MSTGGRDEEDDPLAGVVAELTTRLSKGEKANRKRMATVDCVYDLDPVVRTPAEILCRVNGHVMDPPTVNAMDPPSVNPMDPLTVNVMDPP